MQNEHSFTIRADDMYMGGPVVSRVNQADEAQNSRHLELYQKPKRFGIA
jgi:hypothetical protein